MEKTILTFVVAFCLFQTVYSIRCWECRSDYEPKCADPFDKSTMAVTDCRQSPPLEHLPNVTATMCRKSLQKNNAGMMIVKRDCHRERIGDSSPGCFDDHNLKLEKCETCTEDLCNSATKQFTSFGITAALMAVLKVLLY